MRALFVYCLLVSGAVGGQPVRLMLQEGGEYETTYLLTPGPVLRATVGLTGHIDARLVLDRDGERVEQFRFVGGRVAYSDETEKALLTPFPPVYAEISTRGVAGRPSTPGGVLRPVDPISGLLTNSQHRFSQNEGELITRILVAGLEVQKEVRDLKSSPDTNPLFGSTRVTPVLISENALARRHRIELVQTGGEPRTQPVPELNATLTILEEGGFAAHGEVVGPSRAMIEWAEAAGLAMPYSIDEPHPTSGLPLGILYALGLPANEGGQPLMVDPLARVVRVELPAGGPVHPVVVEVSTTAGIWEELAILSPGDGGTRVMGLADAGRVLVRLKVSSE